jgi:hypothetical protein
MEQVYKMPHEVALHTILYLDREREREREREEESWVPTEIERDTVAARCGRHT